MAAFFPMPLPRPITPVLEIVPQRPAPAATSQLVREVTPKVAGAIRAVLGREHPDVDDATQVALIAFIQALPAFRGECNPAGYAKVIAIRTAIAVSKRWRSQKQRYEAVEDPDVLLSSAPTPGENASGEERKSLVRTLVSELPEEQGEAFALRILFGWSIEEIARETGAPVNTVRSRLRLAKERLRARIEADPKLCEALGR